MASDRREIIPYKTSAPTGARVRRLAAAMKTKPATALGMAIEQGLAILEAKFFPAPAETPEPPRES